MFLRYPPAVDTVLEPRPESPSARRPFGALGWLMLLLVAAALVAGGWYAWRSMRAAPVEGPDLSPEALDARLLDAEQAVVTLRRTQQGGRALDPGGTSYAFADWVLREVERVLVDSQGNEVALSSGEYHLLHALVRHPRQVMSRDRLLDLVRGREAEIFDRAIDNLVSRLRKKIEVDAAHPQIVKTVWGGGYTLACEVKRMGPAA